MEHRRKITLLIIGIVYTMCSIVRELSLVVNEMHE